MAKVKKPQQRFGIGEWYGRSFALLSAEERKRFADLQKIKRRQRQPQPCPFQSLPGKQSPCTKESGVCSLRLYVKTGDDVRFADPPRNELRCTCPNRFKEADDVYRWVAEEMLGTSGPMILKEIPFLDSTIQAGEDDEPSSVGMIDNILVVPDSSPLNWCALEIQAVYFSGTGMDRDFEHIRNFTGTGIPFPAGNRHPDYRSSAPKRLMPQLQIKVPSLRRWGKKMAVVIDRDFFKNMGPMQTVPDKSNCDVAWFIVRFDESQGQARLVRDDIHLTTLEGSVEGLTAGLPVSLAVFEQRMRTRMTT